MTYKTIRSHGTCGGLLVVLVASSSLLEQGAALASPSRPVPGSLTPERLKLPSGPGSMRGLADEPSVDAFNARLDYEVPIALPAGLGGLAPSLSLTYSGVLGNGPVGIAWTLGQPKIQRSMRLGVPKFDARDELELSGIASGRLISIGGGEYRVEGMGQTIRVREVSGGFEVDDGKGVHYRLGTSASSRQEADSTHALTWFLESETNLMGEQVTYEYSRDQGQVYLASATWGPGGMYSVRLDYETRADSAKSYRGGFAVVTARRLKAIAVTASGAERRRYELSYDAASGLSRLSSVTSTGVGGIGTWPVLTFTYAQPAAAEVKPIAGIGTWRLNTNGTTLTDVDGDGAVDLLQLSSSGHRFLANQSGAFGASQRITGNALSIDAVQLQDVDGDSRPELLSDTGGGWVVWKLAGTQWTKSSNAWPGSASLRLKQPDNTRFADLNGDGLIDGIRWNNDGLLVFLGTTTGMSPAFSVQRIGGAVLPTTQGRFTDTNGDGLDDFVVAALDHLDVYVGHGDGTFEAGVNVAYPFPETITSSDEIELADLNRDGLLDLIKIDAGTVRWFAGRPDGTYTTNAIALSNPGTVTSSVVVAVADSNGNGSHDVVWSSPSGMWRMELAGATTAGMLVGVTNGLGMDVTFDYRSSHSLSVDAAVDHDAWTRNVPISIPVPVTKWTALGPGEMTRHVAYSVRDGFWDAAERRFGGFLTAIVTTAGATPAESGIVKTRYLDGTGGDRALRGKTQSVEIFNGAGTLLQTVANTWATQAVTGLPDTPLLRSAILKRTLTSHEDAAPKRFTDVAYVHDGLARATRVTDSGRTDVTGDESVKDTTYADDDTTWIRNAVCEEKVSSVDGAIASHKQHLLGDDNLEHALCVVGKGWLRETRVWLGSEDRFVTQLQLSYDSHGNAISAIQSGVERRTVYDASGLFPIEERMTTPSGRDLAWRASWDPVLGAITAVTDPNGHTSRTSYDSLGRYTSASIDDGLPHQVVEYDWTAPFPKTTVWQFDGTLADVTARPTQWSADSHWRQTVEVANGKGEVRYRAQRLADTQWIISDYHEVDPNSRVVFAGRPVLASQLELSSRPAGIVGDTLVYDPLGRLLEQELATGAKRTYSYAAFERTVQDADLAPVHSVLDGQGRPITTERSLGDGTHEHVQAAYDAAGRLITMTLAGGLVQRTFTYDTLGRLLQTHDPDLGTRTLAWDDDNRLTSETNAAGQVIRYSYDSLGRLITRDTGTAYHYHYDEARPGAGGALSNLLGQLAWTEEPTGGVDLGYDELGRGTFTRRRIDDKVSEATTTLAASGLVLARSFDDGFSLAYTYDPAGRVIGAGDLWSAIDLDASGQVMRERTRNGVDTRYEHDDLDQLSHVTVRDGDGAIIYDVTAERNLATEITSITDLDGIGLDHSATFDYDAFARLIGASIGTGTAKLAFGYGYDVLHNMTSRTASPAIGAFTGSYRYAENGRAPRQLTSIADAAGQVTHTFSYDAAGRQTTADGRSMTFDAADRLLRVDGAVAGSVAHVYGDDGSRVKTIDPSGTVSYFFGDGTTERNGIREHDVAIGARAVARVAMTAGGASNGAARPGGGMLGRVMTLGSWSLGILALVVSLLGLRPRFRRRAAAAGMTGLLLATSCSPLGLGARQQTVDSATRTAFMHTGFNAGPAVFTDADGHLLEERRYEPFGQPIDALIPGDTGSAIGAPDLEARDLNSLNQRTESTTGWSDHGARWMAPEAGRWLTPDPLVIGPDAKLMAQPWALHPYQYVDQNPIAYWDPDGRDNKLVATAAVGGGITFWHWAVGILGGEAAFAAGVVLMPVTVMVGVAVVAPPPSDPVSFRCGDFDNRCWHDYLSKVHAKDRASAEEDAKAEARAQAQAETRTRDDAQKNKPGLTIGLGVKEDLWRNHVAGALTAEDWYKAGLTTIPPQLANADRTVYFTSFREAANNAAGIRFDITNFEVGKFSRSYTQEEFAIIIAYPKTLQIKTRFWEYDKEMKWNGRQFVPVK